MTSSGPYFGYHGNATKTWLITKDHLSNAKELFHDTKVNITSRGRTYLGGALASSDFIKQFVCDKVNSWNKELGS